VIIIFLLLVGVGQTVVRLLWVENQWFYVWSVRNALEERGFWKTTECRGCSTAL